MRIKKICTLFFKTLDIHKFSIKRVGNTQIILIKCQKGLTVTTTPHVFLSLTMRTMEVQFLIVSTEGKLRTTLSAQRGIVYLLCVIFELLLNSL